MEMKNLNNLCLQMIWSYIHKNLRIHQNKNKNKNPFLALTNEFIKFMGYKINTQKSMRKLRWKVRKQTHYTKIL